VAAVRDLVAVLYHIRDRAEALRAYDAFAERLVRDSLVKPSADTRLLREMVTISATFDLRGRRSDELRQPAPNLRLPAPGAHDSR